VGSSGCKKYILLAGIRSGIWLNAGGNVSIALAFSGSAPQPVSSPSLTCASEAKLETGSTLKLHTGHSLAH